MRWNLLRSVAVLAASLLAVWPASAQETLSITGTFTMSDLYPTVGADLQGVYANGNDHWWKLTLQGVTYSYEQYLDEYEGGGFFEQYVTHVHATSFAFEFFGPDAVALNQTVSSQLAGGSLPGGAFVELANAWSYDPLSPEYSGALAYWSIGLMPADPETGVSFQTPVGEWYDWGVFPSDEFGFPLVQPQRLYPDISQIIDRRAGNSGALTSFYDLVDLGSDQQPLPPPPPLQIDVADASVVEGNKGTTLLKMTVKLNRGSTETVTVSYRTANGSAAAPKDYTAASGTLTFLPGETTKMIAVSVKGDRQREQNEAFTVRLSNAVGAYLGRSIGTATIVNDD